jgi:hypothetical protein
MKLIKTLGLTLAMAGLLVGSAMAVPITGSIDMAGTANLNNVALGSATAATSFTGVTVGGVPTGTYAPVPNGTSVAWTSLTWTPSTASAPLWSFTYLGILYSFDLATVSVVSQSNTFLNLLGSGTLKATGFDNTTGAWSFTISNPSGGTAANANFTFANSQQAIVPDGGSALILLGAALMGLVGIARKFKHTA